jgi:pilus assembly protein FimV
VHLSKIKKMSIALGLTLLPFSVLAAGLGQLSIASGIGEPLKAEIELLSVTASEKDSLKAKIAPEATYAAQGLERPASHRDIKVQITKNASGKDVLKLRSNRPMTEPFLDMLVEVEWETGRILREYTVLLDPPGYNREITAGQIQAPAIKSVDNATEKAIAPIKKITPSDNAAQTLPNNTTQQVETGDYLTRKGDTLSKIARRMKPVGVSLDQMLVGLYEANPEAFDGSNMNRLKVGKILQPPSEEALNAIDRKVAAKEIKVQTANWNEYRNKLAGIVAESTPLASEEETQSTSGKIKPATEDQSIADDTGPKDVVKLSSGDAKNTADLEAKITALQEEVSAREKGLKEAQDRTAALEKQIEDMQKLLTLKSDALSEVQQSGEEAAAEKVSETELPSPVELDGQIPVEEVADVKETAVPAAKQAETPVVKPKPAAKPQVPDAPVEQPSFITSILSNISNIFGGLDTTILGAGAGLIALLGGGWFYLRNKRRKNLADFEQGIMTSGGLKANTVFGNTSGASVDTGDTSFLTDFSQSTSGGMIDTNDVDPIAEAEVYMAYGRDAQAEEILKDAISKEPKRYELHLKLLEMYAASKDMSAFETVSGELYTTLGAEDPTWAKVAEIGIKLEPNNPLYQGGDGAVAPAPADSTESAEGSADGELDASDFSDSPLAAEADLDFSLNDDTQTEAEEKVGEPLSADEPTTIANNEVKAEEVNLDVDEAVLEVPNVSDVLETQDDALEFNLDVPDQQTEVSSQEDVKDEAGFAHTMPNLDFPNMEDEDEADVETNESVVDSVAIEGFEAPELEAPEDLTLDMPSMDETPALSEGQNVSLEGSVEETPSEDFGFDLNTLTDDTVALSDADDDKEQVEDSAQENVLDMSGISLEVDDDVNQAISEATPATEAETTSAEPESEEVETKLELVAAYIDMEDKEGAKELLDEVLKEGGENQRKRAEDILATLG